MNTLSLSNSLADSERLVVTGGARLHGRVKISGFKHSLVTAVAAAVTSPSSMVLTNCPDITESRILAQLLREIGAVISHNNDCLRVGSHAITTGALNPELAGQIHGAVYLLPGLASRFGSADVKINGGCQIGSADRGRRPVEHYIEVFQAFGLRPQLLDGDRLQVTANHPKGCSIDLLDYTTSKWGQLGNLYSGATKMAILCAACSDGTSTLRHPYAKDDVGELISVLRKLGNVIHEGSDGTLRITPTQSSDMLNVDHELIPDLIEIVTWICAAALYADDEIALVGAGLGRALSGLQAEIKAFRTMGIPISVTNDAIVVQRPKSIQPVNLVVGHSESIFSDSQPFFALLAASAEGRSTIVEHVWPDRFSYISGLQKLGAQLELQGSVLTVSGPRHSADASRIVDGTDLRAAAVLVLGALGVAGDTVVNGAQHLSRGYPDLPAALRSCGANIRWAAK